MLLNEFVRMKSCMYSEITIQFCFFENKPSFGQAICIFKNFNISIIGVLRYHLFHKINNGWLNKKKNFLS